MAELTPFQSLHYNLDKVKDLGLVVAPPYDTISPEQRVKLLEQSEYNVVAVDLPAGDGDRYEHAAELLAQWRQEEVLTRDSQPSLWILEQRYRGPDGNSYTRRGIFGRMRIEEYGEGRVRPHERTHPGPKEDRLALMRATRANLSPIFGLFADDAQIATNAIADATEQEPWAQWNDWDNTQHRLWQVFADSNLHERIHEVVSRSEVLIADGHHRYETARTYADEIGGDGPHQHVLVCLVALSDPGLILFPTHRVLELDDDGLAKLNAAIATEWLSEPVAFEDLPPKQGSQLQIGYFDRADLTPRLLSPRDPNAMSVLLPEKSPAYRSLSTAVLETLILRNTLGMTTEDIAEFRGLDYVQSPTEAKERICSGRAAAAFILPSTPLDQVRAIAAAGETMPPKSTYFFPKVPTGTCFYSFE